MLRLKGKKALITGASTGIGREIALQFATEGADVAINYIGSPDAAIELKKEIESKFSSKAFIIHADITVENEVSILIEETLKELGTIDILVCNAGVLQRRDFLDITIDDWEKVMSVNLRGPFLCCQRVLPIMLAKNSGRIITIASQLGQKGGPEVAHYAASKAGLIGFTKSLARAVSNKGITVNCIAPGPILTSMTTNHFSDTLERDKATLPLGRQGYASEVAPSAVFLAAEPDGNLYTGQTLGPNSGDVML